MNDLPPVADRGRADALRVELRLLPERSKPDALQEAWLAFLEGRDPARAVKAWWMRMRRRERREVPESQRARD